MYPSTIPPLLIRNDIAMNYKIHVYTLDTINSPFKDPIKILASDTAARTGGSTESVKRERERERETSDMSKLI